jgi:hypothetical protein
MPPNNWPSDPIGLVQQFEAQHGNPAAGALFSWAAWSVDCLHYLDDVDRAFDMDPVGVYGHRQDVIDVAHSRWATSTCITALDLCAAGLARAFCGHADVRELDLVGFDPAVGNQNAVAQKQARRAQLPGPALNWVAAVLADPDYSTIKAARNWLIHSRGTRHFGFDTARGPERLELELGATRLPVRQLVELSRGLATRHITAFLALLPNL